MKIFKRVSELAKANINHLLDQAEDPEVMVKQIIRDMEESIIEMRRETVRAVAREKQIEKQLLTAENLTKDYANKAGLAIEEGNEDLARKILVKKLHTERQKQLLAEELKDAKIVSEKLKNELLCLEDKVQSARRKKEELIRRKRSAEAKMRIQKSAGKAVDSVRNAAGKISSFEDWQASMESYEEAIGGLEADAEAAQEIADLGRQDDIDLEKLEKEKAIEDELTRLKQQKKK